MDPRERLERRIDALQAELSATIDRYVIGPPLAQDEVAGLLPPDPLAEAHLDLLRAMNGITLSWRAVVDEEPVAGSLDILPFQQTAFGISSGPDGEPFEGILWNRSLPAEVIDRLKSMRVIEAVAEEATCLTCDLVTPHSCYRVELEDIRKLKPPLECCLSVLLDHAGVEGIREAMAKSSWQDAIKANRVFAKISRL